MQVSVFRRLSLLPREGRAAVRNRFAAWFSALVLGLALSGCGIGLFGSSGDQGPAGDQGPEAPAGLAYAMTSAVYPVGQPIAPNRPQASGGPIEQYAVAPPLPPGLALDPTTGTIDGTPREIQAATVHAVTGSNAAGSATARVEITVQAVTAAPVGLDYRERAPVYTVGQPIVENTPSSSGGPVTEYRVEPALPAGLVLDPATGVIRGTPTVVTSASDYRIDGLNVAGITSTTVNLTVQAALPPPASLTYLTPAALYVASEPIVPNTPTVTGGSVTSFAVSPSLPAGLSLNEQTGAITGTPVAVQAAANYTITASNAQGAAQAVVSIEVTGRGSWSARPPQLTRTLVATMALLPDGTVLSAGGASNSGPSAKAERYDPGSNSWTATGDMSTARQLHAGTRLSDGRVLVVGGNNGIVSLATAEIYSPATGTWQPAGSMSSPRFSHTATLLADGTVLVIGGVDFGTDPGATIERYDPTSNTWTAFPVTLTRGRAQHAAELLPDGSAVLVAGGTSNIDGDIESTAEIVPLTGGSTTVPMPFGSPGLRTQSARLANGSLLFTSESAPTASRFDPATMTWTDSSHGLQPLGSTLTALLDGRVLLATTTAGAVATLYNPGSNVWTSAAPMHEAHNLGAAVRLADGSVLLAGGFTAGYSIAGAERYQP